MKLTQITEHVYIADGATVTTVYRMGDDCILIDSGHPNDGDDLIRVLGENHLNVRGILSTHYHADHFGNCRRIAKLYDLPVILPLGEAGFCRSLEALGESFGYHGTQYIKDAPMTTILGPVDETIGFDQREITVAGVKFDVFHTPGHTGDNLSFRTPDGVLVVGDVLITPEKLAPLRAPYTTNIAQDLLSKKLVAETPCRYCVMAHRGYVPASSLPGVLKVNVAAFAEIIGVMRGVINKPMTMDEIVPRFCKVRGINGNTLTRGVQMRHISGAIVGYLIDSGELATETALGLTYYIPVNRRGSLQATADRSSTAADNTDAGPSSSGGRARTSRRGAGSVL